MRVLMLIIAAAAAAHAEPDRLPPRDRNAVIRKLLVEDAHLYQCYEAERAKTPELADDVHARVHLRIAPSGAVTVFPLEYSTIGNARVEACILQVIRGWWFRASSTRTETGFMVSFRARSDVVGSVKVGGGTVDFMRVGQVVVHRSTDAHGVPANGLIAILPTGLLLVDTGWTDAETEAILRWGTENLRGQGRWIGAVITHDHDDRDGGLGALHRAHIPVAALDLTVAKLRARGDLEVTPLFAAKDGVFHDPRGFEAFYPGPGHATDNIVLAFPTVLFGGCLIKSLDAKELGFTGDANLARWPAAVQNVESRYMPRIVVPGHGAVDDSGTALQHTLDLLTAATSRPNGKSVPAAAP